MSDIYAIVTHHKDPQGAAEAWKNEGVCAIGWSSYGNLKKAPRAKISGRAATARDLFLRMRKDDVVLAYSKSNTIAYVGNLIGRFRYNQGNVVGDPKGFYYANQRAVKWWKEPHHFDKQQLPRWFSEQLGKRGFTIKRLDLQNYSFQKTLGIIRNCALSGTALNEFEDLAKAGIRKYVETRLERLEPRLEITRIEHSISETDRPDFIARDRIGKTVLIECKGAAVERDCRQLLRYGANYKPGKRSKPRLMLVAFAFDQGCRKLSKQCGIEMVECDLRFSKL